MASVAPVRVGWAVVRGGTALVAFGCSLAFHPGGAPLGRRSEGFMHTPYTPGGRHLFCRCPWVAWSYGNLREFPL
jgi:hypothetical protein